MAREWIYKDPVTFSYIAGLIDGEGSICANFIVKHKKGYLSKCARMNVMVRIAMSDIEGIEFIRKAFPGNVYIRKDKRPGNYRDMYAYAVGGSQQIKTFLEPLIPYLKVKKEHAELAIKIINTMLPVGKNKLSKEVADEREFLWKNLRNITCRKGNREVIV